MWERQALCRPGDGAGGSFGAGRACLSRPIADPRRLELGRTCPEGTSWPWAGAGSRDRGSTPTAGRRQGRRRGTRSLP